MDELRSTFERAGLQNPPIPSALSGRLRRRGPWCWSTRAIDPLSMYRFDAYPLEALTSEVDDYVAVSHAGHGVNSYSINYHLVLDRLAIFSQIGWGGAYMDGPTQTAEVSSEFEQIQRVVDAWERVPTGDLGHLTVLHSPFRSISICSAVGRPVGGRTRVLAWLRLQRPIGSNPLDAALALLSRG